MRRYPNRWKLRDLYEYAHEIPNAALIGGSWVPARPSGFCSIGNRLKCAWLAFTGRADVVEWPGQ